MNERVKNLIVDALRSGDYKRCTGHLTKDGCFCVNGLILELYRQDTGDGKWDFHDSEKIYGLIHNDGKISGLVMQPCIIDWLGFKVDDVVVLEDENKLKYWFFNDRRDTTFDIMANKIEKYGVRVRLV
jgi:hypothetical protein